jgi:integral membrane protein
MASTRGHWFFVCQPLMKSIACAMPNWKSPVGRVRLIGMFEGVSFLLLMGVAMPLKYLAGLPEAVKWTGWIHGILFIGYGLAIFAALVGGRMSFWKSALAFGASLIPFGPFLIDRTLAGDEALETEPG